MGVRRPEFDPASPCSQIRDWKPVLGNGDHARRRLASSSSCLLGGRVLLSGNCRYCLRCLYFSEDLSRASSAGHHNLHGSPREDHRSQRCKGADLPNVPSSRAICFTNTVVMRPQTGNFSRQSGLHELLAFAFGFTLTLPRTLIQVALSSSDVTFRDLQSARKSCGAAVSTGIV